jgi:hypothetical protein
VGESGGASRSDVAAEQVYVYLTPGWRMGLQVLESSLDRLEMLRFRA